MEASGYPENRKTCSTRWVCPSDRQLTLRAKLKTGWSVKSSSLDLYYDDDYPYTITHSSNLLNTKIRNPLTPEEQERIMEVIRRAEVIDQTEQERVGKLVDRLENIKRNVLHVTTTRSNAKQCGSRCLRYNECVCCCALCGEKFSFLGVGSNLCKDCRRYVCGKCCIETITMSPSKTTKRPQQNISNGSLTSLSTIDTIEIVDTPKLTKILLCRVCTETREMWKKSGAWFYKSLPKYILPEKKKSKRNSKSMDRSLTSSFMSLEHKSSSEDDISLKLMKPSAFHSNISLNSTSLSALQKHNQTESELDNNDNTQIIHIQKDTSPSINQSETSLNSCCSPNNQLLAPSTCSLSTSPSSPQSLIPSSPLSPSRSASRLREQQEKLILNSQISVFYTQFSAESRETINSESSKSCQNKLSNKESIDGTSSSEMVNLTPNKSASELSNGSFNYQKNRFRRRSDNTINDECNDTLNKHEQDKNQTLICQQVENTPGK